MMRLKGAKIMISDDTKRQKIDVILDVVLNVPAA